MIQDLGHQFVGGGFGDWGAMASDRNAAVGTARRDALPPNSPLNDYKVERVLGSGGFGIVYLARHVELDRPVAIKEYLPTECAVREGLTVHAKGDEYRAAFEEGLGRFRDEARRLVDLDDHPAIVSCRDFFRANGTAYLVMEYADGEPLSEVLRAREARGRPFAQSDLLNVVLPLLEGLAQVHAAGVIHRDIKPGNIMIRKRDGHPVLIDFGAAKQGVAELSKSMAPFTEGYAAVEQVGDGKLGPWTDIYAVGAVMWRMVAGGNPPWEPPTPLKVESRASAQLSGEDDPLPTASAVGDGRFSRGVLEVIENCLRLQAAQRIQDCGELSRGLREEPATVGGTPRPGDDPTRSDAGSAETNRGVKAFVPALGALLLAGGVLTVVLLTGALWPDQTSPGDPYSTGRGVPAVEIPWAARYRSAGARLNFYYLSAKAASDAAVRYRSAAEQGDAWAQYIVGHMYDRGLGVPQDYGKGLQWLRKAAEQGHAGAQYKIGVSYDNGEQVLQDIGEAATWYRKAAEQGFAPAQYSLGNMYASGRGMPQDYGEAVAWYQEAASQRDAWVQGTGLYDFIEASAVPSDEAAVASYRKAANLGDPWAQHSLGLSYSSFRAGVQPDYRKAATWFRKAAEQGLALAQNSLAIVYSFSGYDMEHDHREAMAWFRKAADQGNAWAQHNLGVAYWMGIGLPLTGQYYLPQDHEKAAAWFRKAANQGNASAQWHLGRMYTSGQGVRMDHEKAAAWYRMAAEQWYTKAQYSLGYAYSKGRGVPQDHEEAAAWFRKVAEWGNPLELFIVLSQSHLGDMYANGQGVPQDDGEAVAWYRKAADLGNASAQNGLGNMYADGRGVPQDDGEAVAWYRRAADQEDASAQNGLGNMYADGRGVPQDDGEAVTWYRKAADRGNAAAQSNLGLMNYSGRGIPQDYVRAYAWWSLAASQNDEDARGRRDDVARRMTLEQISEAQRLSRELVPQ